MSKPIQIDKGWTLFLDRDGVINKRLPDDYVKSWKEFEFLPNSLEAIRIAATLFDVIVVVTNQQGIGKGLMTSDELGLIHEIMCTEVLDAGGRIDKVFFCPELAKDNPDCRKPNTGMAIKAREDFPSINFSRSLMIGDSPSDMEFGIRMGMQCAFVGDDNRYDSYDSLIHVIQSITSK